jgi:two-component system, cell cycle sensor histidine kinase and response regulator CckA
LVINAAEAIGDKPGVVTITTGQRRIGEHLAAQPGADAITPGEYVFLRVEDTGSGMDKATIAKIFDPFFTTKFTGRGLGLSAALGIVRGHKGFIGVESILGQGSAFQILLPAAHEKIQSGRGSVAPPLRAAGSGLILIVDDEEMVRRTAAVALEHCGYQVMEAGDGLEAIELFKIASNRIALVLLDLSMPLMTGEDCLNQLKQIRPDVPVLLSSGFPEADAIRRFKASGFSGFLQKPYTAMRLAEMARAALSGVRQPL